MSAERSRGRKPDVEQFCETLEQRAKDHGYDIVARPRSAPGQYEWTLDCGHKVVLGVGNLRREPRGRVWCAACNDLRIGNRAKEIAA